MSGISLQEGVRNREGVYLAEEMGSMEVLFCSVLISEDKTVCFHGYGNNPVKMKS